MESLLTTAHRQDCTRGDTRIPFGFEELKYEKRLKIFSLPTLKDSRSMDDLMEMHKVEKV